MKGTYLGEFQEIVLLTILILGDQAYGVSIQVEIGKRLTRHISRGALHSALSRLSDKGFINSNMGGATEQRGGRRKRFYRVSNKGIVALQRAKELRDDLWKAVPHFSLKIS